MFIKRKVATVLLKIIPLLFLQWTPANAQTYTSEYIIGSEDADISVDIVIHPICEACWNLIRVLSEPSRFQELIENGKVVVHIYPVYMTKYDLWLDMFARCTGPNPWIAFREGMLDENIWDRLGEFYKPGIAIQEIKTFFVPSFLTNEEFDACSQNNDLAVALVTNSTLYVTTFSPEKTPLLTMNGRRAEGDGSAVILLYEELEKEGYNIYDVFYRIRQLLGLEEP